MYEHAVTLQAPVDRELRLWIEPWCDELAFAPGTVIELHGQSPLEGELVVEATGEYTVVFGWPGSVLWIEEGGALLRSYTLPVPDCLTKDLLQAVFGTTPAVSPTMPPATPPRLPWWRRWWRRPN